MENNENCMNCKNAKKDFLAYLLNLDHKAQFYEKILSKLSVLKLKKKKVILKEGEISKEAFWLQSGYGRYFRTAIDENGVKYQETFSFCKPGKIVFIAGGFFNDNPSEFGFELAAESVIIPFSKESYESLKMRVPDIAFLANRISSLNNKELLKKNHLLNRESRERYKKFLNFFGKEIEQCFTGKQIANHLGIQSTYFCRLKKELLKGKTE